MTLKPLLLPLTVLVLNNFLPAYATAFDPTFSGKLALTGGVSEIEGAAGGGLTPWALIAGDETEDQVGANAYSTWIGTQKFNITSKGFALGFFDRVEVSFAHLIINTGDVGEFLGLGSDFLLAENIYGVKVKLYGDAVKDQDSWLPQVSLGTQIKRNTKGPVPLSLGAVAANGTDFYLAMTKIILDQSLLLNLTLRETQANQFGLLGFAGNGDSNYQTRIEASAGYLFTPEFVFGGEFRQKPNNINNIGTISLEEDSFKDIFAAWAPSKHLSLTLAYVWMGTVATEADQSGAYLSVQASF